MSYSKAGKKQQITISPLKQTPDVINNRSMSLDQTFQLYQTQQIKIQLGNHRHRSNTNKKSNYNQYKSPKAKQPFQKMLSREQINPKKYKTPDSIYVAKSQFELSSKSKYDSPLFQKTKYRHNNLKQRFQNNIVPTQKIKSLLDYERNRRIVGHVDFRKFTSREMYEYQQYRLKKRCQQNSGAPGQYSIQIQYKLPEIRFEKQTNRDYYYKDNKNDMDYNPNYKMIQKRGDINIMNFKRLGQRKANINNINCLNDSLMMYDYGSTKILTQVKDNKLIQFDRMLKKKDEKVPNYLVSFGNRHIAQIINQQII